MSKIPSLIRHRVRDIYHDECANKTDPRFLHNERPVIHHIEPSSLGGTNEKSNLIALCPDCEQFTHSLYERGRRK